MILFDGSILDEAILYIGIPVYDDSVGVTIGWRDATSSATITIETTDAYVESEVTGEAWEWADSGETVSGPTGSASGCVAITLGNCRQRKARLKIVATADCDMIVST